MQTVKVNLGERSYAIHIGPGLLREASVILPHLHQPKTVVVTNDRVAPLYLDTLSQTLGSKNIELHSIILPDGEESKNAASLNMIYDALLRHHTERNTTLLALGGGVIGDLAGFAAATYMRGVPFIQIPTTLLAQVDSSIGGKTGINHPLGKNMIGAFYQPRAVLIDTSTLTTLPDREFRAGLAEVIKYGLIRDAAFLDWLDDNLEKLLDKEYHALSFAIQRSCENKAAVVAADEHESGLRAILNLGHTFGHAIETATAYKTWLHGEAVAVGMVMAADLSRRLGWIGDQDVARVRALIRRAGLPVELNNLKAERLLELMGTDKKVERGQMRFVLLKSLGQAVLYSEVPIPTLFETLDECSVHV
jgi:3-dehydroquinate synthase